MSTTANLTVQPAIAPDLFERLQALAEQQGITMDEALGQAVGLSKIVQETKHDPDSEVLIVRNGRRFKIDSSRNRPLFYEGLC